MLVMGATPDLYTWRAPSGRAPAYSTQQRRMRSDCDFGIRENVANLKLAESQKIVHFQSQSDRANCDFSGPSSGHLLLPSRPVWVFTSRNNINNTPRVHHASGTDV